MNIEWFPYVGTNKTGSVTDNAWMTYSGSTRVNDCTSTWYTTNGATYEYTGVQLEVGDVATDFEHRSYGDELARCQRYFEAIYMGSGTALFKASQYPGGNERVINLQYKVEKRAQPTITKEGNAVWQVNTPSFYPSKTDALIQHGTGDFYLTDANGDLCLSIGAEL